MVSSQTDLIPRRKLGDGGGRISRPMSEENKDRKNTQIKKKVNFVGAAETTPSAMSLLFVACSTFVGR